MQLKIRSKISKIIFFFFESVVLTSLVIFSISKWGYVKGVLFPFFLLTIVFIFIIFWFVPIFYNLMFFLFLIPFFVRLNASTISLNLFSLEFPLSFMYYSILSVMLLFRLYISSKTDKFTFPGININIAIIIFLISGVIATIISPSLTGSLYSIVFFSFVGQIVLPIFFMYIFYISINTKKELFIAFEIFYWSFIILIILGLLMDKNINPIQFFLDRPFYNLTGPNVFAAIALLFFPTGFFFMQYRKKWFYKTIYFLASLFILFAIISTISRGAIIVIILEMILLLISKTTRKYMFIFLVIISVGLFYSFTQFIDVYFERFGSIVTHSKITETSSAIRLNAWIATLKALPHYILGVGGNQFQYIWSIYGKYPFLIVKHSHHLLLGLSIEYGILAGFAFIYIFYILIKKLINSVRKYPENFIFLIAVIGCFIMSVGSEGPRAHIKPSGRLLIDSMIIMYIYLGLTLKMGELHRDGKN